MLSVASSQRILTISRDFILKFGGDFELKRLDMEQPHRLNGGDSQV